MDQKEKDTNRKAIQTQREKDKDAMLSGIVDEEQKLYTFECTIQTKDGEKTGSFVARVMSIMDRLTLGTTRAKLLDGAPSVSVDGITDDIAYMIAFLQTTLVKTPEWFDFDVMDNLNDLYQLFWEVKHFHDRFRSPNEQNTNVRNSEVASGEKIVEGE